MRIHLQSTNLKDLITEIERYKDAPVTSFLLEEKRYLSVFEEVFDSGSANGSRMLLDVPGYTKKVKVICIWKP